MKTSSGGISRISETSSTELPVDFWIVDAEAHMMPADIRQVRLFVHEILGDPLALLGIAQPLEHRLTAALLRPGGNI